MKKKHISLLPPPRVSRKLGVLLSVALPVCLAGASHAEWRATMEETITCAGSSLLTVTEENGGRAELKKENIPGPLSGVKVSAKAWSTTPAIPYAPVYSSGGVRVQRDITYKWYSALGEWLDLSPIRLALLEADGVDHVYFDLYWSLSGSASDPGCDLLYSANEPWLFHQNGASSNFHLLTDRFVEDKQRYTGDGCSSNFPVEDVMMGYAHLSYSGSDSGKVEANLSGTIYQFPGLNSYYVVKDRREIKAAIYCSAGGDFWRLPGTEDWSYNSSASTSMNLSKDSFTTHL
jgi:hypothetical protein